MPTIEDLRAVLTAREVYAGDAERVLARVPAHRSRPVLAVAVSIAAVVALALGTAALLWAPDRGPAVPATVAPPTGSMQYDFTFRDLAGYTFFPFGSWFHDDPGIDGWTLVQGATIAATDSRVTGIYDYIAADAPPDPKVTSLPGEPVTVGDRAGVFSPGSAEQDVDRSPGVDRWAGAASDGDYQPRLRWRNADGSWSVLSGTFGFQPDLYAYDNVAALSEMTHIATAVAVGGKHEATLPFRALPMPANLWPSDTLGRGAACVRYADADISVPPGVELQPVTALAICRTATDQASAFAHDFLQGSVVLQRDVGDGTTLLVARYGDTVSAEQAQQILTGTDVSPSLTDRSTWLAIDG